MDFIFALLVLFLYAKVFGEVVHHFGFSSLIGEVGAGIIFGPAILNWIQTGPAAQGGLQIEGVAQLGLIVMMLVSGMNSRFDLLSKIKFKALTISLPAAGLSFALAFLIPYALGVPLLTSLFIGVALSNTATDIVARVARGHRLEPVLVGAGLIDDVIAVYTIGMLSIVSRGQTLDVSGFIWTTIGIILFFVIIAKASKELIVKRDLMRFVWKREERGAPIAFALSLALALGAISHQIGLHMIIGAYMAGLFISRLRERPMVTLQSRIRLNNLLSDASVSLESVLTPIFFAFVGLQLTADWGNINPLLFLGLLFAAFGGKFIGGGFGATLAGLKKERWVIGSAMISRGALELALLHFGLAAGVLSATVFSVMVLVVIMTAIFTPILFKLVAERI